MIRVVGGTKQANWERDETEARAKDQDGKKTGTHTLAQGPESHQTQPSTHLFCFNQRQSLAPIFGDEQRKLVMRACRNLGWNERMRYRQATILCFRQMGNLVASICLSAQSGAKERKRGKKMSLATKRTEPDAGDDDGC